MNDSLFRAQTSNFSNFSNNSPNFSSPSYNNLTKSLQTFNDPILPPPFHFIRRKTFDYQISLSELSQTVEKSQIIVVFPLFVINPLGFFRRFWNFVMLLTFLFTISVYPALVAFDLLELDLENEFIYASFAVDVCFCVDIFLNFFSAFEDSQGKLVYRLGNIAKIYLKTWFLFDFLTTIPFYWLIAPTTNFSLLQKRSKLQELVAIEGPLAIKALSLLRILKSLRLYSKTQQFEQFFLATVRMNRQTFLTLKFIGFIAITVHIASCTWFYLCKLQSIEDLQNSWIFSSGLQEPDVTFFEKYVTSMYFIVTVLMSVGYGDLAPITKLEIIYFVISIFFAMGMFGYIMTTCITLFSAKLSHMAHVFMLVDQFLLDFKVRFRVSRLLHWKMLFFFKKSCFFNDKRLGHTQAKLLNMVPLELHFEIVQFLFKDFLEKFDFFLDKPISFVTQLLPLLKPSYFLPGNEIYKQGDPSQFVYFVEKGRAVTCCEDLSGKERAQIYTEGTYFGEVDMIFLQERLENCFAETELQLLKVEKTAFLRLLSRYDSARKEVEELAMKRSAARKLYRKPKTANVSLLPRNYWTWKRNREFYEMSIEETHLNQSRSTIRKSILEGSAMLRSGHLTPISQPRKTLQRMRTFSQISSRIVPKISGFNEKDVEIEDGEIEKVAKEKIAGLLTDEVQIAGNRKEIMKVFDVVEARERRLRENAKKNKEKEDLEEVLQHLKDINEFLNDFLDDSWVKDN